MSILISGCLMTEWVKARNWITVPKTSSIILLV